ncbi:UNVERIFIED_CONTAM: hypothetical protein PYX00_002310 [Menopon gallinae]|uniref:Mitochondrial carrier protein n=1 Tax=Menopon gallinae TaxID=328185 RepID=A0AAW2IHM3_9NEOP
MVHEDSNNDKLDIISDHQCHLVDPKDLALLLNPLKWEYKEFFCGWCAAFTNICITYPINKITFRQMLHNLSPLVAAKQVSNEGIYVLYRGILPPLLQKTTSLSLMFGVYEGTRKPFSKIFSVNTAKILAAMTAGTTEAILAPFERDELKKLLDDDTVWYGRMGKEFIMGGLIGALISTFFYPLNVLKVHLQSRMGGEFQNIFSGIREIYIARGRAISSFYRGVHLNYTRGFISWGVITVSSETIRRLIY